MRVFLVCVALLLFGGMACAQSGPQPTLPIETISIETPRGPVKIRAEMATNWAQQERGLMFRRSMEPDAGMLFDFHRPIQMSFWMKNTYLPLDIIFIRADGTVSSIAARTTPMSRKPVPAAEPVRAVLELNAGRAAELGIAPGSRIRASIFAETR